MYPRDNVDATHLELLFDHILFTLIHVLSDAKIEREVVFALLQSLCESILQLADDGKILVDIAKSVWIGEDFIDVALGKLLQGRFESGRDGLVEGLEVTLALISSLNSRVRKSLCPSSPDTAASTACRSVLIDRGSLGGAPSAATATTSAASASAAPTSGC